MAAVDDTHDHDDAPVGEVPVGLDSEAGQEQEFSIEDVAGTEPEGRNRTKITLRNGAIVVVTGAVIAGAIAAVRYRRRHKGS
jgi:hypothetical protein